MVKSARSDAGRDAGVWAINSLADSLGPDWLRRTTSDAFILSPFHLVAFGELLDLALRLHLLKEIPGMATVRRDLRGDPRVERIVHTRMILTIAGLAVQRGHGVVVEARLASGCPAVDVILEAPEGILGVETFAVLMDDTMRHQIGYAEQISRRLRHIPLLHGVEVIGHMEEMMTPDQTESWIRQVEQAAEQAAVSGKRHHVVHPVGNVTVVPIQELEPGEGFSGPVMRAAGVPRLRQRILSKAAQAANSGARWLNIDLMDGLWQFTAWSQGSLAEKAGAIAEHLIEILRESGVFTKLDGMVVTCGPAFAQGEFYGESAPLHSGVTALRRLLPAARVRETVVIPFHTAVIPQVVDWVQLYDSEPSWMDWGLRQVGLQGTDAIFGGREASDSPRDL